VITLECCRDRTRYSSRSASYAGDVTAAQREQDSDTWSRTRWRL